MFNSKRIKDFEERISAIENTLVSRRNEANYFHRINRTDGSFHWEYLPVTDVMRGLLTYLKLNVSAVSASKTISVVKEKP